MWSPCVVIKLHDVYNGSIQILYYTTIGRGFGVVCKFPKMACLKTGENGGSESELGGTPFLRFEMLGKFWLRNEKLSCRNWDFEI